MKKRAYLYVLAGVFCLAECIFHSSGNKLPLICFALAFLLFMLGALITIKNKTK